METADSVIKILRTIASEGAKKSIERYGIPAENAMGVKTPQLREVGKKDWSQSSTG